MNLSMNVRLFWFSIAACASVCVARSSGPDISTIANRDNVCNAMRPHPTLSGHGTGTAGDGDYRLEINPPMTEATDGFSYTADTAYTIGLVGTTTAATIRGFLVQARVPGDTPTLGQTPMLLGSFQTASGQQTYDCDGAGVSNQATITHSQRQNSVSSVQFTWMSPSAAGVVDFYYTVMRITSTHYDGVRARVVGVLVPPAPTTPAPTDTGTTIPPTTVFNPTDTPAPTGPTGTTAPTEPQTTPPPGNPSLPIKTPEDYRLNITSPDGCSRSSCEHFIAIDTNTGDDRYIDIYMEGTAAGWIAVGFSDSPNMYSADVVACNRLGDSITAIDGWNIASPSRGSLPDDIQDVIPHNVSFDAGNTRISCIVSKRIVPLEEGSGQDLDLTDSLYVIYARRVRVSPELNRIETHAIDGLSVRGVSAQKFAIASDTGAAGRDVFDTVHRPNLIRAHGILMIIAWPLLATTAIFFAIFLKPALPNGEWFQVHRAFLLASLFIGATAFVLIFVALKNSNGLVDFSSNSSRAHMIIGIIVMALQILNPLVALCRCKPTDSKRWIFNMFHSAIGNIAQALAITNVAIGLSIFSQTISQTFRATLAPLWVSVAWDGFYVLLVLCGFITFWVYACITKQSQCAPSAVSSMIKKDKDFSSIEMTATGSEEDPEDKGADHKPPSKDAPLRWGFLAIYLVVTVPIFIAVIVMVALP